MIINKSNAQASILKSLIIKVLGIAGYNHYYVTGYISAQQRDGILNPTTPPDVLDSEIYTWRQHLKTLQSKADTAASS